MLSQAQAWRQADDIRESDDIAVMGICNKRVRTAKTLVVSDQVGADGVMTGRYQSSQSQIAEFTPPERRIAASRS